MRKILVFIATSVDGYYETSDHGIDWHMVDDEFNEFSIEQLDSADTLLFGRTTYEIMAAFWPTEAALGDSTGVTERMNAKDKVVVSTTLDRPDWEHTRLISTDVVPAITALKAEPGRDILVFGSSKLTASLLAAGLVDELRIIVMPVVLGDGVSLLNTVTGRVPVTLVDVHPFKSGNVLLRYRPGTPSA